MKEVYTLNKNMTRQKQKTVPTKMCLNINTLGMLECCRRKDGDQQEPDI